MSDQPRVTSTRRSTRSCRSAPGSTSAKTMTAMVADESQDRDRLSRARPPRQPAEGCRRQGAGGDRPRAQPHRRQGAHPHGAHADHADGPQAQGHHQGAEDPQGPHAAASSTSSKRAAATYRSNTSTRARRGKGSAPRRGGSAASSPAPSSRAAAFPTVSPLPAATARYSHAPVPDGCRSTASNPACSSRRRWSRARAKPPSRRWSTAISPAGSPTSCCAFSVNDDPHKRSMRNVRQGPPCRKLRGVGRGFIPLVSRSRPASGATWLSGRHRARRRRWRICRARAEWRCASARRRGPNAGGGHRGGRARGRRGGDRRAAPMNLPTTAHGLYQWNAALLIGYLAIAASLDALRRRRSRAHGRRDPPAAPADWLFWPRSSAHPSCAWSATPPPTSPLPVSPASATVCALSSRAPIRCGLSRQPGHAVLREAGAAQRIVERRHRPLP
jgi:hypothetical protein